ncbi:MAG: phosphate-starvation-inducible PsiE family protein [Gammaproteobacteria bacterium]|nr:phosphate-starvation-inducible PsiE family protein [Gammaproteobacteria bacterium]
MEEKTEKLQVLGSTLVDVFHNIALFVIGATVVWSAAYEYLHIMEKGYADLKDILLLFIYLELGAMIGIYFKTHRLPVQFLVFIAITALSRHLVIDVQKVSEDFHLYLLLAISGAVVLLSVALLLLTFTERQYGRPEDDIHKEPQKKD